MSESRDSRLCELVGADSSSSKRGRWVLVLELPLPQQYLPRDDCSDLLLRTWPGLNFEKAHFGAPFTISGCFLKPMAGSRSPQHHECVKMGEQEATRSRVPSGSPVHRIRATGGQKRGTHGGLGIWQRIS